MDERSERFALHCAQALDRVVALPYDGDLVRRLAAFEQWITSSTARFVGCSPDLFPRALAVFSLETCRFDLMLSLLSAQGARDLFPRVVSNFFRLYRERHAVILCKIMSSHELSDDQKQVVEGFLHRQTQRKIVYTAAVDRELIAGIRIQGESFLWEQSVAHRLRLLETLW